MKRESYLVIQDWMYDLGLRLPEIVAYAVIFGFSQDDESDFHGGRTYLARKMASTKPTVDKALQTLEARGLIRKDSRVINGVTFSTYVAIVPEREALLPFAVQQLKPAAPAKVKITPAPVWQPVIAEEAPELICDGVAAALDTLSNEPKWKGKSANAWKLRIRKLRTLAAGDCALAVAIIEQTICRDWAEFYTLKETAQNAPHGAFPGFGGTCAQPAQQRPGKGGVLGSEAIVAAAMEQYNRVSE